MYDVIRAQLDSAQASIVAARSLLEALFGNPPPSSEPEGDFDGICRHDVKLPIPGRAGWVCQECSYNHSLEEA